MLNIRMLLSDHCGCVLQSTGEAIFVCVEVCPAPLELRFALMVQTLPIIVDDEISDYMRQIGKGDRQDFNVPSIPLSFRTFNALKIFCSSRF